MCFPNTAATITITTTTTMLACKQKEGKYFANVRENPFSTLDFVVVVVVRGGTSLPSNVIPFDSQGGPRMDHL